MGKRSCTSNPAVIELEHEGGVALPSSKRRVLHVDSNTAAIHLLAMRMELPKELSEEAFTGFPLNKPPFPLHPQRQVKAAQYSLLSITDDEDENKKNKVVTSKKRPDVFHNGPRILTPPELGKPILSIADTRRREAPNNPPKFPFGRPLPPAPLFPSLLLSRGVFASTHEHKDISSGSNVS